MSWPSWPASCRSRSWLVATGPMAGPVATAPELPPLSLFRTSSQTPRATRTATATTAPTRTRGSRAQDGRVRSFTTIQDRFRSGVRRPARLQSHVPGRLAQLGEHQLDKLGVTGSSPVPPIYVCGAVWDAAWLHG